MSICKTRRKYSANVSKGGLRKSRGVSNMWNYRGMQEVQSCVNILDRKLRNRTTRHFKWQPVIPDVDLQDWLNRKQTISEISASVSLIILVGISSGPFAFLEARFWSNFLTPPASKDESFDSSRIVSIRQHFLLCIVHNILIIDVRPFHALRTWKVHVVTFSYYATHFPSLLTCALLNFRYVDARLDFRHTTVISHITYASRLPVC